MILDRTIAEMPTGCTKPRDYRSGDCKGQPKRAKRCICGALLLILEPEMLNTSQSEQMRLERRQRAMFAMYAVALCVLMACSSTPKNADPTSKKALNGTDESIFLEDTIEK